MLNAASRDGAAAMPSSRPACQPLAAPCLHARQGTKGCSVNARGLKRHARQGCDEGGEGKGRVSREVYVGTGGARWDLDCEGRAVPVKNRRETPHTRWKPQMGLARPPQAGAADYSSEEGALAGAALSLCWAMIPYRQVGSATTARSQYSRATPGFLSRSAATFPSL